jgi:Protein of unknown function (DUF3634)
MAVVIAFAVATFIGLVALWLSARKAITICVLQVVNGEVEVSEGLLGPRVLDAVRDVVRRPKVGSATLRLSRAKDFAKLDATGKLTAEQLQQLRNIVGNIPIAKLLGERRAQRKR